MCCRLVDGGWQALLLARAIPRRIKGLVTIAAAPDFTEDGYWANFTDAQKAELEAVGHVALPSDYMEPYIITKRMIEDGRTHLVCVIVSSCLFLCAFCRGRRIRLSALRRLCGCWSIRRGRI